METEVAKLSGVRRSKAEIMSILQECSKSKLNVKEFVKTKGIHEATYYNCLPAGRQGKISMASKKGSENRNQVLLHWK